MAQYRLTKRSYVNDALLEAGAVIEYGGEPAINYEPLDVAAKAAVEAAQLRRAARAKVQATESEKVGNQDLVVLVKGLIDRLAAITANVAEHDAGLQLISDRLGAMESLKRGKPSRSEE